MEAINRPVPAFFAGAILATGVAGILALAGALNAPSAIAATVILGIVFWLIVPTTTPANLSSSPPDATLGVTHTRGSDASLDAWVGRHSARGGALTPTVELEARASLELGTPVGQGPLRDAIDRYHGRAMRERIHRQRRVLARP